MILIKNNINSNLDPKLRSSLEAFNLMTIRSDLGVILDPITMDLSLVIRTDYYCIKSIKRNSTQHCFNYEESSNIISFIRSLAPLMKYKDLEELKLEINSLPKYNESGLIFGLDISGENLPTRINSSLIFLHFHMNEVTLYVTNFLTGFECQLTKYLPSCLMQLVKDQSNN